MALLGTQLVITLITVSLIQKLSPYYSFSRWLLCSTGLFRYLYPTNSELRLLLNAPKKGKKSRNKYREDGKKNEVFQIPKNLDIELESTKITPMDLVHLRFYQEYRWLVDFALYSTIVYFLTEVFSSFTYISNEINLSMLWCFIVLIYSVKIISSLTSEYFRGVESIGERSAVVVMGFVYLVTVMIILIIDESIIETGLDSAYADFSTGAIRFLNDQGFPSHGPASKLILKFSIAIWSSFLGAILVFPGLRLARMHYDILTYCGEKRVLLTVLNINFLSPLLLCLLWIKPISHEYLTARIFFGMSEPLLSLQAFETLRLALIIVCMMIRLVTMPIYLQAYLNMAYYRVKDLKTEVGKITNIDLQKKVASVFYYMCVVVLQYMLPLVMCLFLTFMYKTLGEYEWKALFRDTIFSADVFKSSMKIENGLAGSGNNSYSVCAYDNVTYFNQSFDLIGPQRKVFQSNFEQLENSIPKETLLNTSINYTFHIKALRQIFTKQVYRGLFGFSIWWTCFTWFLSSNFGLFYYMYFKS